MIHHRNRTSLAIVLGAMIPLGCAPAAAPVLEPVPESEIPALQARLEGDPDARDLQARVAASLLEAGRCDEATALAQRAVSSPFDSWPTLIEGGCLEESGRLEEALVVYGDYLESYGRSDGAPPVRGQALLAERRAAESLAPGLVQEQARTPSPDPGPLARVAVLPFRVRGDDGLEPVGRSLAVRLSADLAEVDGLEVVDPLLVRLVFDRFGPPGGLGVDSAQARRVGQALGAGQVIQGTAFLDGSTLNRLGTDVVRTDGTGRIGGRVEGPWASVPRLEKELSLATAEALGWSPNPDERTRILYRGPRDTESLQAYGGGLDLQAREAYGEAAPLFAEVVRLDPEFEEAREALEANAAAAVLAGGGLDNVLAVGPAVADAVDSALRPGRRVDPTRLAIRAGTSDVSATQGERVTGVVAASGEDGSVGSIQNLGAPALLTPSQLTGLIRILIVIPGG